MRKIGILASSLAAERNMEHVLFRISGILAEECHVDILGADAYSERILENRNVYPLVDTVFGRLPGSPGRFFRKLVTLYRYCKQEKPDVILTLSGIGINGLIIAIVGRLTGTCSVNRVTSDMYRVHKFKRPLKASFKLFMKNNVLGHIAIRIAHMTVLLHKAQLDTFRAKGFPDNQFYVVAQPLEFPEFHKLKKLQVEERRASLGFADASQVIGVIGRMDQDKNLDLLENICLSIWESNPGIVVLLIGSGGKKQQLENTFKGKNAFFIEQVPRDELSEYYQLCDCILQTSYSEGLSSVIGESLFFGVPVVASDSGPMTKAMLSNICYSSQGFVSMILDKSYILDSYPEELQIENVKRGWKHLVEEALL
jgi:glycosyltransferase involved in cell wall biosynthesis